MIWRFCEGRTKAARKKVKPHEFPPGWDEKRVRAILAYYEGQSEAQAVAEDEAAYEQEGQSMVEVPSELVPKVRSLIAQYELQKQVERQGWKHKV